MKKILVFALAVISVVSCDFFRSGPEYPYPEGHAYSSVAVLYSVGYNNLKSSIDNNWNTICSGLLPMKGSDKVLISIEHQSRNDSDWSTPTQPLVIRYYGDWSGTVHRDTLMRLENGSFLTDPLLMAKTLNFVKDTFDAVHYGVVFSSHGTGWLPERYYDNPDNTGNEFWKSRIPQQQRTSFGCEARREGGKAVSYEMDIKDMAAGIPYKLDYIIFDCCLMGGVEVAYELRNCSDFIGFSQTEVLSSGFNYKTFVTRLLGSQTPDPQGFCEDYFEMYNIRSSSRYATVSCINTTQMDSLVAVCSDLFEKYRNSMETLVPDNVQQYYRGDHPWFYDLEDVLNGVGLTLNEKQRLASALERCVKYEAHTPTFFTLDMKRCCGFSMFLPNMGTDKLKQYYKSLAWNKATLLVK